MNNIDKLQPVAPENLNPALVQQVPHNGRLPKVHFEAAPENPDVLRNKNIQIENYEPLLREGLQKHIRQIEKLEKSAKNKMTLLKILFVSLLILGIICAASFFLLPVLGQIAGALGLSITTTLIAWQIIFLGGGVVAGLSFIPRRFIKGFEDERNQHNQKVEFLKERLNDGYFHLFLEEELLNFRNHEKIASSTEFAELYYLMQNLQHKENELARYEQELEIARNRMVNPVVREELQVRLNKIEENLQLMRREIQELGNEANDIRANLAELDRK